MRLLLAALLTASCAASGCVSWATSYDGIPITEEMAAFPKVGETTKQQVLEKLGSPRSIRIATLGGLADSLITRSRADRLTVNLDRAMRSEVFTYERTRTTRLAVILLLYNDYTSDQRTDRLTIVFDKDDKVFAVGWTPGASAPLDK